jgi:hypothetical protein
MSFQNRIIFLLLVFFSGMSVHAQGDSSSVKKDTSMFVQGKVINKPADSVIKPAHSPHKAAVRSAIIPGWGQVYNKKIWKVPIVYTAIGIPVGLFVYNKNWYERTNYAYAVAISPSPTPDSLAKVHPDLLYFVNTHQTSSLVNYRNEFRKNMDYCVLFFLLAWALNIVDATVDAHLMGFNVSPDLSIKFKPNISPNAAGLGLAFDLHSSKPRVLAR